jgi:SAM-dependent methyltransferase
MEEATTPLSTAPYVHGYSPREAQRLEDQAGSVRELIHGDTLYPPAAQVLEVACGVGAQTETIAAGNPETRFISFELSVASLRRAVARLRARNLHQVRLLAADLFALPFSAERFDYAFVSYVLEHMRDPMATLVAVRDAMRPGGHVTVVEGDHGSCYFSPQDAAAQQAWNCLIRVQADLGGDALIGRRLYPLLASAGFEDITVSPRMVYADASHPDRMESFVAKTIVPMVEGVKEPALAAGLVPPQTWEAGLAHLRGLAESPHGVFCYTFFKAVARKPA